MKSRISNHVSRIIVFLTLILITLIIYLPGLKDLGLYRDDWNNVFNAYTQGAEMLIRHYESDRPADGYLLMGAYKLFGPDPYPYLLLCLLCRFLAGFFFYLTLTQIWTEQKAPAFVSAAFFILFPGFLQQIDGIAYLPHQTAILCISASIYLTFAALETNALWKKLTLGLISVLLALAEMFLMEYYIGLEAFRFFLILIYLYNRKNRRPVSAILKAILYDLPWIVGMAVFMFWRSFVFVATRNGADLGATLAPLLEHPKYEGLSILSRLIKNTAKIIFGSWTVQPYNVLNGTNVKIFWPALVIGTTGAIFLLTILLLFRNTAETEGSAKTNWQLQWVVVGFLSTVLVITPMILTDHEITFASSLDRFTYPGSFCAILFLTGLIYMISVHWVRNTILAVLAVTAGMVQIVNKENYINTWQLTRDFWWQLSWRAPDIKEESFVVANPGAFSPEEDYEIFSPLHLIYYPERDHVTIGSEVLNMGTVQNMKMGIVTGRTVRTIFLWKDHSKSLVITKPTEQSCLQVIDGRNPVFSVSEWSNVVEAGPYSDLSRIITDAEPNIPPEEIFGGEPERGWCWYYEKMSLAQQKEDWDEAIRLADEAIENGFHAEDRIEWIPVVQAMAYAGRIDDARSYGEILKTYDFLKYEACNYYRNAPKYFSNPAPSAEGQAWLESEFCE